MGFYQKLQIKVPRLTETILIVDDNVLNLKLVDFLLTAKGFTILTALNAEEALQVLAKNKPDLILMDIQLPGIDGLALTKQLKQDPNYKHIPIIALTAYAMKADKEKALAAGCDGYITKPIDTHTLPETIKAYLKQSSN